MKKTRKYRHCAKKIMDLQMFCNTQKTFELLCLCNYESLVGQNKNIEKGKKEKAPIICMVAVWYDQIKFHSLRTKSDYSARNY